MIRTTSSRLANQGLNGLRVATTANTNSVGERRYQGTAATVLSGEKDKYLVYDPLEGYYKTSQLAPRSYMNITLDKYVWSNFRKWEKKTAAIDIVTGRSYTYAKLRDCSATFAIRLQSKFKLKPLTMLSICLPNCPEYLIAMMGAIEAGLTVTTVNPIYTAEEIGRQLVISNANILIGTVRNYQTLREACALAKKNVPIIVVRMEKHEVLPEGAVDFYEIIDTTGVDYSTLIETNVDPSDMVLLPFSSGTTGLPKGVMLSHNNITVNCEQCQSKMPYKHMVFETTDSAQEVVPCVLPFFHIYGITVMMISKLFLGLQMVILPQFKPDDVVKALSEYKATTMNVVPPIALFLTHSNKVSAKNTSTLRMVMSGAAPMGQADVERFRAKFPQTEFSQGYGMTEASPVVMMTPNGCRNYNAKGLLMGGTEAKFVALDSTDGRGVGPNVTGELLIRGPQIMKGYLNNEEANRETFCSSPSGGQRWLRTGDVGHYDEEGLYFITDRMKELIKVKGFQVPPAELEECLRTHPKILDAAVIGIPHEQHGEVPKGIIVLKPNVSATEEEIKQFVAEKVAVYKQLEGGVVFVKEIPKNPTGKILRKDLKEKYC